MRKLRGLLLASTATRHPLPNGALASPAATSWESEDSTGATDNCPVLAQHAEQGALVSTENVLPDSGFSVGTPDVQLERGHRGEPSLSGEPECLSLSTPRTRNSPTWRTAPRVQNGICSEQ